jgi:hypothetical protein
MSISDDELPDWNDVAEPIAANASLGAYSAMITEQVLDYERAAKSFVSMLMIAHDQRGLLRVDIHDALDAMVVMSPADLTICAHELFADLIVWYDDRPTKGNK